MYFPARTCAPYVCIRIRLCILLLQLWAALFLCWVHFTPLLFPSYKPGCATFPAHTFRVSKTRFDKTFAQSCSLFLQAWHALVQCWVHFTLLLFPSYKPGCTTFQSHTCRPRKFVIDMTFAQTAAACLCRCDMRCFRSEYILVPCCFDLTTLGVRYSRRTLGLDGWYLICQMTSNNLRCEMDFHAEANSQTKWKI